MLPKDFWIKNTDRLVEIYNQYTDSILETMATEISELGRISNVEAQAKLLMSSNVIYKDMIQKLSKLTNMTQSEIKSILRKTAVKNLQYDNQVYKEAGFEPAPLSQSPQMLQIISAVATGAELNLQNLVRTSALNVSNNFYDVMNTAYLQVATGATDYNTAISGAINQLVDYGTTIEYGNGHHNQLDVVVRRNIMSSMRDASLSIQLDRASEFNTPYIDIDAHSGARPTHAEWQGLRFCLIGSKLDGTGKYYNFYDDAFGSAGRPVAEQLKDYNCRHNVYPVMYDDEEPAYSRQELKNLKNETVTYNGEKMSKYEAEQKLRYMERTVRNYKRRQKMEQKIGVNSSKSAMLVTRWNSKIKNFCTQTGVTRRQFNEKIFY